MAAINFGSPTYLFREACRHNLKDILTRLAACGFDGVELFSMFGRTAEEINDLCRSLGLRIICDHIGYDEFISDTRRVLEQRAAIGARFITIMSIPENNLPGSSGFSEAVTQIERIGRACKEYDMQLLYHSHGYDLIRKVDGVTTLELLLDNTDPELMKFQPDLGWIALGGGDPSYFLDKYGVRCRIIHLKDYYAAGPMLLRNAAELGDRRGGAEYNFFEFRPSGFGIMNFPKFMPKVLDCNPEWIVTDHDLSYERDEFEEMKMSLEYVKNLVTLY